MGAKVVIAGSVNVGVDISRAITGTSVVVAEDSWKVVLVGERWITSWLHRQQILQKPR